MNAIMLLSVLAPHRLFLKREGETCSMSIADATLVSSKHFHLEELAEGVYAAIATIDGGAVCNAGIIDLGDQLVIFDTFLTPQAATDLRAAAERLVGRAVTLVINSHWHGDHVQGNMSFP